MRDVKGIVLAGGSGTRLYPVTRVVSKQLLPVYDKPMIYYPLSALMLAGIRDVLIISTPRDTPLFEALFGNGARLGMRLRYAVQDEPRGIADAFRVGAGFIGGDDVALVLGDNIFYGGSFACTLRKAAEKVGRHGGAVIFGCRVSDPASYGVLEFGKDGAVAGIEEKPVKPKSSYAVPGLYFYDNSVVEIAKSIMPSARGELEITDVNNAYIARGALSVELLGRDTVWLDAGTYDALLEASSFIAAVEKRQGAYVSCIEEIAYRNGWISADDLARLGAEYRTDYGHYLERVAREA